MQIKQIINNNIVFSQDLQGNEIVVVGKGIGFHGQKGDEINDMAVEKIFTLKDETEKSDFAMMINEIPYEVVSFGFRAIDYIAACCTKHVHKRHLLPLIDHIYTTLERYRQGISLDSNVLWNIRFLYPEEYKIAVDVTDMMVSAFDQEVDAGEACYITLHVINAELDLDPQDGYKATDIIEIAIGTVEEFFDIILDRESLDFVRFVTHLQFFAKRMIQNTFWNEEEDEISRMVRYQYRKAYACTQEIIFRIEKKYSAKVDEREYMYLTIHIARLLQAANEIK